MSKIKRLFGIVMSFSIILSSIGFFHPYIANAESIEKVRISGDDRYITAIEISKSGWTSAENVVLAVGENFPDALCAAPLAEHLDAPILLTQKNSVGNELDNELSRLKPKNVFLIGGYGVISENIENSLRAKGMNCIRLAGNDRYETSINIADYISKHFSVNKEAVIVTGEAAADALSIAPIAARKGIPILLSPKDTYLEVTKKYISDNNITKVYVIGGTGVISEEIAKMLPNPERIYGSDRYETNTAVLNKFSNDIDFNTVYFATGEDFPDALAGSALAPKSSSSIVLVHNTSLNTTKSFITTKLNSITKAVILGGEGAVKSSDIDFLLSDNTSIEYPGNIDDNIGKVEHLDPYKVVNDPDTGMSVVNDQILITFKEGVSEDIVDKIITGINGEIVGYLKGMPDYQVRIKNSPTLDIIKNLLEQLKNNSNVEIASLNHVTDINTDNYVYPVDDWAGDKWDVDKPGGKNWGLEAVKAPYAWKYNNELKTVKVGIVDAGFDIKHEDLKIDQKNAYGADGLLLCPDYDPKKKLRDNHGTHVAGIIGAMSNNKKGITGVAWNSDLYVYRTNLSDFDMKYGILWALKSGAKIINFSLGNDARKAIGGLPDENNPEHVSDYIEEPKNLWTPFLRTLVEKGYDFLIVKCAGNEGIDAKWSGSFCAIDDPELCKRIIVVGAMDKDWLGNYKMAKFQDYIFYPDEGSNYGEKVDILAPGVNIYSTITNNNYDSFMGTSQATPFVTGAAALMWGANPDLKASDIKKIIVETGKEKVAYKNREYGILDAKAAVEKARDMKNDFYGLKIVPNETFSYIDTEGNLKIKNYKDGTEQMVIPDDNFRDYDFNLKDGLIAYTSFVDPGKSLDSDVILYDLKSKEKKVIDSGGPAHSIKWSPDYKYFSVTYGTGAGNATYLYNMEKKTYTNIPAGTAYPMWSPDGSKAAIAFYWEDYNDGVDMGLYYPGENKIETVMEGNEHIEYFPIKWQDNSSLIFCERGRDIGAEGLVRYTYYRADTTNGDIEGLTAELLSPSEKPLYEDEGFFKEESFYYVVSPDGKYELCTKYGQYVNGRKVYEDEVVLRNLETQAETTIGEGDNAHWVVVK